MSANILLNSLNELGKRDKMRGLPSILFLFCNKFNKFNNTGARMIYSIYYVPKIAYNSHFWRETLRICHYIRSFVIDVITLCYKICKPLVIYRF